MVISGTPAAPDKSIQWNNNGVFGGDSSLIHDLTNATNRYGVKIGDVTGASTGNWNLWTGPTSLSYDPYDDTHNYKVVFNQTSAGTLPGGVLALNNWSTVGVFGFGLEGAFYTSGTGGAEGVVGTLGAVLHGGSGTIETATGLASYVETQNGNITNAIGFRAEDNYAGGGIITNSYGFLVDPQDAGVNNYNLWSGSLTTVDLYGSSTFSRNVFATNSVASGGEANVYSFIDRASPGGIALIAGTINVASTSGVGQATELWGNNSVVTKGGSTGTVTNAIAYYGLAGSDSGTITNAYIYLAESIGVSGSGAVTNAYGIKVNPQTEGSALNFGIYSGADPSLFDAASQGYFSTNVFAVLNNPGVGGGGTGAASFINQNNVNGSTTFGTFAIGRSLGTSGQDSYGGYYEGSYGGSGTMDNAYGMVGVASNTPLGTPGTLTNAYGFYASVNIASGGGTITNSYGLFLESQAAGTNNWNLYSGNTAIDSESYGGSAKNFFVRGNDNVASGYSQAGVFANYQTSGGVDFVGGLIGITGIRGTSNANGAIGVEGDVIMNSPGKVLVDAWGFTGFVSTDGGTITRAIGVYGQGVYATATGATVTNAYGAYFEGNGASGGGVITNNYGVYISDQTAGGTLNYSLYTNAGNIRLGSLTGTGTRIVTADTNGILGSSTTASLNLPATVANINTTGLTANVGATTLYAVPSTGAGMYLVEAYLVTTTAASISSTMPNAQVVYTDLDSNTSVTLDISPILGAAGLGQNGLLTANAAGTIFSGTVPIYVKASTTIQYKTVNYSSTAAGMTYALHIKLQAL